MTEKMENEADKTFELMTLMYSTMQDQFANMNQYMNHKFGEIDQRFEQIDQRFEQIDQRFEKVEQSVTCLESELKGQIAILHDGISECNRKIDVNTLAIEKNTESIDHLSLRVISLESVVKKHEVRLKRVK